MTMKVITMTMTATMTMIATAAGAVVPAVRGAAPWA